MTHPTALDLMFEAEWPPVCDFFVAGAKRAGTLVSGDVVKTPFGKTMMLDAIKQRGTECHRCGRILMRLVFTDGFEEITVCYRARLMAE